MTVLEPSKHVALGGFVESEADRIHMEMSVWIEEHGDHLTQMFDANFKTWRYFGVSSYGRRPKGGQRISDIVPLRVLDPFIWNLYLEGIVKRISK